MLQWAIELSEFGIEFQPRLSMKGQVMADFVLEYSQRPSQRQESSEKEWWTLRVDGASRSSGSGVGLLLQSPTGEHLEQAIRLGFPASNNEVEYEAILSGLDLALALSISKLRVYSDSQLVVRHVQKEYEAKDARMARYLTKNTSGQALCPEIPNRHTRSGTSCPFHPNWGHLYKRSFTGPYLRCLSHSEAQYVLAELHEGVCENHSGGRSLAHRAHSQGYYWPTMKKDAAAYVKKCDKCQRHTLIPHMPSETFKPVSIPWPFAQWGMDIVGPLPAAPTQKKFLLVATDYFSKWVEAEAYASIKEKDVTKFRWKNIVCRFGIPHTIIADNGPQFDSIAFRNFCSELNIRNSYSTPRYPQSNGQAEATNKTLITALKKRLEQAKGKWVEKLPGVLWAYRTTPGWPTGNTPFALAYGMDAVIPTEIGLPTIRTEAAK
ncbi:Pro-Pol polyprotein [Vitis vinifera]|uniref:Pro-Pol polyprotein n=1 Tax=Vitis vinifera TaxID=29760 RepID=A0A438I7Q6_VITVI|nr:Pro-Pol polyprotein [Vitis vinifera]